MLIEFPHRGDPKTENFSLLSPAVPKVRMGSTPGVELHYEHDLVVYTGAGSDAPRPILVGNGTYTFGLIRHGEDPLAGCYRNSAEFLLAPPERDGVVLFIQNLTAYRQSIRCVGEIEGCWEGLDVKPGRRANCLALDGLQYPVAEHYSCAELFFGGYLLLLGYSVAEDASSFQWVIRSHFCVDLKGDF